jgi:hypothetical protein
MRCMGSDRKLIVMSAFCLAAVVGATSGSAAGAEADHWGITPGKRIGQVTLGMKRQGLHALLGSPSGRARRESGVLIERWSSGKVSAKSAHLNFRTDFLTVYYQGDRVVQVDASSPAFKLQNGLSTRNSVQDFEKRYRPASFRQTDRQYLHDNPDGIPAGKHFVHYEDDVKQGLALRYGWWGNLAPDGDPKAPLETLSVHRSRHAVLLDPDGADQFTITAAYVRKHGYPTRKAALP